MMSKQHSVPIPKEFMRKVVITPDEAETLLTKNQQANRNLIPTHVMQLAKDLKGGRWACNGETLIFDVASNILDGQHRLAAIVAAGVPMTTYAVFNVPAAVMPSIDIGKKRELSHTFQMSGYGNSKHLASAWRFVWELEHGLLSARWNALRGEGEIPTLLELEASFHPHAAAMQQSCLYGDRVKHLVSPSLAGGLHYCFAQRNPTRADQFFAQLRRGEGLAGTDAVLLLRERLVRNQAGKAKLPRQEIAALFIKAWNAFCQGRRLKALRWKHGGDSPEDFPTIHN